MSNTQQFSFDGIVANAKDPASQTWIYAREAREQQAGVPDSEAWPYPSVYYNNEPLALSTPGSQSKNGRTWLHYPLIPGRSSSWSPDSTVERGAIRSFFTAGNSHNFDVGYHDPRLWTTGGRYGDFVLARYHPKKRRASTDPLGAHDKMSGKQGDPCSK